MTSKKKKLVLSSEELEIEKALEDGYIDKAKAATKGRKAQMAKWAKGSLQKRRRINLRLTEHDYRAVQWKATDEGMPYQTLIASIVHKYVTGALKDTSK
jgi:predicted DNA binding CopG/RHH family protein